MENYKAYKKALFKIKIKIFVLNLLFELFVNTTILFIAYFENRVLPVVLFYISFHWLRYAMPKVYHAKIGKAFTNIFGCLVFSVLCFWMAMKIMMPVNISIFSGVVAGIFINFMLYKIQDYLDLKKEIAKQTINIYKMTEEELRNYAKSKGLSEMIIDTLVLKVIHNYRWVEIRNERNYTRRGIDYHKQAIEKKLNIKL